MLEQVRLLLGLLNYNVLEYLELAVPLLLLHDDFRLVQHDTELEEIDAILTLHESLLKSDCDVWA